MSANGTSQRDLQSAASGPDRRRRLVPDFARNVARPHSPRPATIARCTKPYSQRDTVTCRISSRYADTSTGDINPPGDGLVARELIGAFAEEAKASSLVCRILDGADATDGRPDKPRAQAPSCLAIFPTIGVRREVAKLRTASPRTPQDPGHPKEPIKHSIFNKAWRRGCPPHPYSQVSEGIQESPVISGDSFHHCP